MLIECPESQATGRVSQIYADIRAASGVGMVSLCYRHVAAYEGALDWAWRILGPDFVSGRCRQLAQGVVAQDVAGRLAKAGRAGPSGPELPPEGVVGCEATIDAFNRANPLNFMFIGVLERLLAGEQPLGDNVGDTMVSVSAPDYTEPITKVPPIVALDDMAPALREKMMVLGNLGIGQHDLIVPSLYRHVAHWPDYIDYLHDVLTRPGVFEVIEAASYDIRQGLERAVDDLFAGCAARDVGEGRPAGAARTELRASLPSFQPRIPLMIATGYFLKEL